MTFIEIEIVAPDGRTAIAASAGKSQNATATETRFVEGLMEVVEGIQRHLEFRAKERPEE